MTQTFRYMLKQNSMTRTQSEQSTSSEEKQTKQVSNQMSEASDEKEQQNSLMRGLFDRLFEDVEADLPKSLQTGYDSGARGINEAMPNKRNETPIQSSSSHHYQQLVEVFYYQLKVPLLVSIVQEAKL